MKRCDQEVRSEAGELTISPVCDVVDEVLFEHEAPPLDDVEQRLFEGACVDAEPVVKQLDAFDRLHLVVDLLIRVNLADGQTVTHRGWTAHARNLVLSESQARTT